MKATFFRTCVLGLVACHIISAPAVVFTSDTLIDPLNSTYEGQDIVVSNCVVTVDGPHAFSSLRVATGGTLTHLNPLSTTTNAGLFLTISNDVEIEPGAFIKATGLGFGGGLGTGSGSQTGVPLSGGGGGYGGYGGMSSSNAAGGIAYDSAISPTQLGSGGGNGNGGAGGAGGGTIQLIIGNRFIVNGTIAANGLSATNNRSGGGSGGSFWVVANTFEGSGAVTANGGAGEPIHGGGGGGGRIAIEYGSNSFSGTLTALGGVGWQRGGAGTIFERTSGTHGLVTMDNGGNVGANTLADFSGSTPGLVVQGKATAIVANPLTIDNLIIRSNSSVIPSLTNNATLTLIVNTNATIETGAAIPLDGEGAPQNSGSGVGQFSGSVGAGAGHGGYGGIGQSGANVAIGGSVYDSTATPTLTGSGGRSVSPYSAGAGGGVIRMTVLGNLRLDGRLSVDATSGFGASGGGSGGSIWLTLGGLSGSGAISANGGSGGLPYGGGGAGGRIAVYYATNNFSGSITARAGNGAVPGGAGTIFTKANSSFNPSFTADNGGLRGTNTVMDITAFDGLFILGGSSVLLQQSSATMTSLIVASNSTWLLPLNSSTITISSNATIAGVVSADGGGTAFGGSASSSGSGGGGNGGYGGRGGGGAGGIYQGNSSSPTTVGGRGGALSGTGPNGGGATRITVGGVLSVDGRLTANGLNATSNSNGGGAGGSIWLNVGGLSGSGLLAADGGAGHLPLGGGGSGGRIAVNYTSNSFAGVYSAKGGAGFGNGAAGTVYIKPNAGSATFIADNGGLVGTNTILDQITLSELKILGGAWAITTTSSSLSVSNLIIATNSALLPGQSSWTITVSANTSISGLLSLDASGTGGNNPGGVASGGSGGGGGGGYGGAGGGAGGGVALGSISIPTFQGGRGGSAISPSANGGGALHMTVNGLLTLNGKISSSGGLGITNALGGGGGGGGGSVWLTTGGLSGAGTIATDGGAGMLPLNGGGGGGHIAVYYTSNTFAGTYSARGGIGLMNGGAGIVFLKANNQTLGRIMVDNGGLSLSTNTLWDSSAGSLSDVSITGGGAVISTVSSIAISNLTVGTNSSLLLGSSVTMTLTGTGTVSTGGAITSEGTGTGPGSGIGNSSTGGAGAGHGGNGGNAISAAGGTTYDSASTPNIAGSRGGSGLIGLQGGLGGGALHLTVNKLLSLNGRLSVNGSTTVSNSAGAGSGGALWLNLGGLSGSGSITADGGSGSLPGGGGGGGGRIALYYTSNTFTGVLSAKGGAGFARGGAGTIYSKANNTSVASVVVDNGGIKGTNTSVSSIGTFDLIVQGGGVATSVGTPRDLIVHSNGWVSQTGNFTVSRDATIEAGAGIILDGLGSGAVGGLSSTTQAGGGGHGGTGGRQFGGNGLAYDSALSPTIPGSVGGNGSGTSTAPLGGAGGGAAHLTVGSTLKVDGQISSAGLNGDLNSGGGLGGSIWITTTTLSGQGFISAKGGMGNGSGGGGGGGRVAITYTSNLFTGSISACGGTGFEAGGAGTIYLKDNSQPLGQLSLDNCGVFGATTPLSQALGLVQKITAANGAIGEFQGVIPVLSNVLVKAGGVLTGRSLDTNMNLAVTGDVVIQSGGVLQVNAKGYGHQTGPGAGGVLSNESSGGGYGGVGGASATGVPGGSTYGVDSQPFDRGSGGGVGPGPVSGSSGGGAIRLTVSGQLALDGIVSADGGDGIQDDSGGGSGGSVWITAGSLAGAGTIAADGGVGELFGGGGGGGGRIAVYSPNNTFVGLESVEGGSGAQNGGLGTVFNSAALPGFAVISQSPSGVVPNTVGYVTLGFSSAIDPASLSGTTATLATPNGNLAPGTLLLTPGGPSALNLTFPTQNVPGDYRIELGPGIQDLLGQSLSQVYTGAFTLSLPLIVGTVTDTNGVPVPGATLQQTSGPLLSTTTDGNGLYSLGVDTGWSGTVVPSFSGFVFVPGSRSYTNLSVSVSNENYVVVPTISPVMTSDLQGSQIGINWYGISGVTYQMQYSTNLTDWFLYGSPAAGTNGPVVVQVPIDSSEPQRFFRVGANN